MERLRPAFDERSVEGFDIPLQDLDTPLGQGHGEQIVEDGAGVGGGELVAIHVHDGDAHIPGSDDLARRRTRGLLR